MTALSAQRLLMIWEQSLECVRSHKLLIETRIAERVADYPAVDSGDRLAMASSYMCNGLPDAALLR
jgi:hypothetical protein